MHAAWERLIEMGLPDGAPRRPDPGAWSDETARRVLTHIDVDALPASQREPLLAWLEGYRHHWPSRWQREMRPIGDRRIEELSSQEIDVGRYLKLRRIAVAQLARLI